MVQLTGYSYTDKARGLPGGVADMSNHVIDCYAAEGTIQFGAGVQLGTDPQKQRAPFAGGTFAGVAIMRHNEAGEYADGDAMDVMTDGRVFVDTLAVDVVAGETAYIVDASGVWSNVATDATAVGKFFTTGTGVQVVQLDKV